MKKVYISLDTEWLSGLVSWNEMTTDPSCTGKAYIRELDWILDELFKVHPEIEEVCIWDSHARGENLPYGVYTDPRVYIISGYPRQDYMLASLDSSYDMLMLVGYGWPTWDDSRCKAYQWKNYQLHKFRFCWNHAHDFMRCSAWWKI